MNTLASYTGMGVGVGVGVCMEGMKREWKERKKVLCRNNTPILSFDPVFQSE